MEKAKVISPSYTFLFLIILLISSAFGAGWIKSRFESEGAEDFSRGYWVGYSQGYSLKIADYKYWCQDKYGWIPQEKCSNNDVCMWLSNRENQIYGNFSSNCFEWFQEQMYQLGQESQKSN